MEFRERFVEGRVDVLTGKVGGRLVGEEQSVELEEEEEDEEGEEEEEEEEEGEKLSSIVARSFCCPSPCMSSCCSCSLPGESAS